MVKICEILDFFGGYPRHSQKTPKISTNTYRTKLNLCYLNSVGNTLEVEYKFGSWQTL